MAFIPRFSELSPLFHLLEDYEAHRTRPTCRRSPRTSTSSTTATPPTPTFTPAFDVRERDDGYYLDGELPGVDQGNIDIEFTDPQTLVIKGRTERAYGESTTNGNKDLKSTRWRQPTVQNEDEDEDAQSNTDTDATTTTDPVSNHQSPYHYWVSERSIGNFQRTFTFPTRVDQDAVRANLKNGILSVFVPKEAAPRTKKIRVL
ncbi:hypothetical protein N7510_002314 [Penicillium lagena]|uniref:uncharacterized protein n=1 Tax=Penicillium lagena TaxID=94218 RepID=UPI002541F4B7|nr:uncharacterized protein N7510_002314 [Penicillium lagena]KAJ5626005.1 hypothetical protein N7510_002314 [Penicillium lagena]